MTNWREAFRWALNPVQEEFYQRSVRLAVELREARAECARLQAELDELRGPRS